MGLAQAGTTLLVSSHVMDEGGECDELLLMRDGALLTQLTPDRRCEETGERDLGKAFLAMIERREQMSAKATGAAALRVLRQIRHNPRTIALLLVVPAVLLLLLYWVFEGEYGLASASSRPSRPWSWSWSSSAWP